MADITVTNGTLTTTAATALVSIDASPGRPRPFFVANVGATDTFFIGPSTITTATGYPVAPGTKVSWDATTDTDLYGCVAASTTGEWHIMVTP
jgi:hypothetical protein